MGSRKGQAGVGVVVAERWVNEVVEVKRICETMMVIKLRIDKSLINIFSVYAPQAGRSLEEKEQFYVTLGKIRSEISRDERVVICGDFNGHVGKEADGFEGVHGGYSFGVRNAEGEMLLEFAEGAEMLVANTCFMKKDHRLITYASGEHRTVVDYVMEAMFTAAQVTVMCFGYRV